MTTLALAGILFAQKSQPLPTSKWKVTVLEMPRRVMTFRMTPHSPKPPEPGDAGYVPPKYLLTSAYQTLFVATMTFNNFERARIWKQAAGKVQDLAFIRGVKCEILGLSGSLQVGKIYQHDRYEAVARPDSNSEFTELHPKGATASAATGISDGRPVGTVWVKNLKRAAFWPRKDATWNDLSPKGSKQSEIRGAFGGTQFGCAELGAGLEVASLWRGSARSWVNLNPKGSLRSAAEGGFGNVQVGNAQFGRTLQAGYWLGTAKSWVNLSPPGASYSNATGAWRKFQVGTVLDKRGLHPCVWESTAKSIVYLDRLVNASGTLDSRVLITGDETNTYIYATLKGPVLGYDRVVVFTRPVRG